MNWYENKKLSTPHEVWSTFLSIREDQNDRVRNDVDHLRLYGNLDYSGFASRSFVRTSAVKNRSRVSWNIVQSAVDTLTSKLGKNKPKPQFLPNAADYETRLKTEKLSKFCLGQIQSLNLYSVARQIFRDACIFGTGYLKIFHEGKDIKAERVFPTEVYVDLVEGMYGAPRQMFQCKSVPRDVLIAQFPKFSSEIKQAAHKEMDELLPDSTSKENFVEVLEAWRLPNGKNPGKHVIAVSTHVLHEEPWEREDFPIIPFRWLTRPVGFYGQGVAEQLDSTQQEINKLLYKIQRSMELMAVPTIFVERSSNVVSSHLTDQIGKIVKFTGKMPSYHVAPSVHPEVFNHLERLWEKGFNIVGLSQLTAASQKPAGLNAGVALRTYHDIETERFAEAAQQWEEFFLEIARQLISTAKQIAETEGTFTARVKDKKFFHTIEWSEVDLDEDKYVIDLFPVSLLPSKPEGKLQRIQELSQLGFVSPEMSMELLDIPDLERFMDLKTSARDAVRRNVDGILNGTVEDATVEPFDDLEFSLEYARSVYHKAKLDNAPEESLEQLRQYMVEVMDMMRRNAPQPAQNTPLQAPAQEQQAQVEAGMLHNSPPPKPV